MVKKIIKTFFWTIISAYIFLMLVFNYFAGAAMSCFAKNGERIPCSFVDNFTVDHRYLSAFTYILIFALGVYVIGIIFDRIFQDRKGGNK